MSAISNPSKLKQYALTTVTFEDLAADDGQEFAFQAGQPYAALGLFLYAASVEATANLKSASGGVAARSDTIYSQDNTNSLSLEFSSPQRAVGFYYRDLRATSLQVSAYDGSRNVVDGATFSPGDGFAGFVRASADIQLVRTFAPHQTFDDAAQSRTYIDDLSFGRELKSETVNLKLKDGQFLIVVGSVTVDGGGFVIGPDGVQPVPPWNPDVRQIVAATNLLGEADLFENPAVRRQLKSRAASLLKASLERLAKTR